MTIEPIEIFHMCPRYPTLPIPVGCLDIGVGLSMVAAADGISFPCTGEDIILVQGGTLDHVITIKSVKDQFSRTGDIVYTVGAGLLSVLPQFQPLGFAQPNDTVVITGDVGSEELSFWALNLTETSTPMGQSSFTYRVTVTAGQATTPKFTFGAGAPAAFMNWGDGSALEAVTAAGWSVTVSGVHP